MAATALPPRRSLHFGLSPCVLVCFSLLLACHLAGCKKESNPVGPGSSGSVKIVVGTSVEAGSTTIGTGGGTLTISKPGTPVDGMRIRVPSRSYAAGRTFEVSYAPVVSHQLGTNVSLLSPLITISNGGGYADSIMSVRIPAKVPAGYFAMGFFYDEATGELEGMPLLDRDSSSVTIGTRHFTSPTAAASGFLKGLFRGKMAPAVRANVVIATIKELDLNAAFDTHFRPGVDDWGFCNFGSHIAPKGHCWGQSVGALWYFNEKKANGSPALWMRFDNDGNAPKTPDIWQDDVLGYKFCSVVQTDYDLSYGDVMSLYLQAAPVMGDLNTFALFAFSIYVTNRPQLVTMWTADGIGHTLIVYGIVGKQLFVCDPNYSGDLERRIIMNTLFFDPYYSGPNASDLGRAFTTFRYTGIRALFDTNPVDAHWQELANKTIGNGRFPTYTILVENNDSKLEELKDGFRKSNGTFALQVQGNGFVPFFRAFESPGTLLANNGPFHLSQGDHRIGVAVYDKDTSWVGFRWFTVNAGPDTSIFPLAVGNSWTYTYTSYRTDGSVVGSQQRVYSVIKDTLIGTERWYKLQSTIASSTSIVAYLTNRADGSWWMIGPGTTQFLRFKYPGSLGTTYTSGPDGSWTMKILQKDVSFFLSGLGTFTGCYVYEWTLAGTTDRGTVKASPGTGPLVVSEYEQKQGGGEYLSGEEVLTAYTVK